ncbi:hypothetical protein T03_6859 [Trichinella britovi]|uniref:Uncharacterized protein n=1 Tax=Trichinella britovi TaxID=45882 RepID=A0A0V1D0Q0_TRIBR|nr:hypothetical protein T03_6859 [Trichinella britovi]
MPARPIRQRVTLLPERVLLAGDATKREARPWMGRAVSGSGGNGALDVPPGLPPLVPLIIPQIPQVALNRENQGSFKIINYTFWIEIDNEDCRFVVYYRFPS